MMKTCSKCNQELPATLEYFAKKGKYVSSYCKKCNNKRLKKWKQNNPEKRKKSDNIWKQKNKEKVNLYRKNWAKRNPKKQQKFNATRNSRRRAKIKGNGWEPYTEEQMLSKYGTICYLCNEEIDLNAPRKCGRPGWEKGLQKDHVISIDNNGPDTLDNVRPTHGKCNNQKRNKEIYEKA